MQKYHWFLLRISDFDIPHFETICYVKHSISYLGPFIWSKLSTFLRASESLNNFEQKLKNIDLSSLIENNSNCSYFLYVMMYIFCIFFQLYKFNNAICCIHKDSCQFIFFYMHSPISLILVLKFKRTFTQE